MQRLLDWIFDLEIDFDFDLSEADFKELKHPYSAEIKLVYVFPHNPRMPN